MMTPPPGGGSIFDMFIWPAPEEIAELQRLEVAALGHLAGSTIVWDLLVQGSHCNHLGFIADFIPQFDDNGRLIHCVYEKVDAPPQETRH
jgi:hypothetical protein